MSEDTYDSDVLDFDGELSSTDSESEEKAVSPPKKEEIEVEQNSNLNESFESDVDIQSEEEAVFENGTDVNETVEEHSWKILGEQRFVEKKFISSAPSWAENPTTFDVKIQSRTGDGIDHLEGLDPRLFERLQNEISVWFPVQKAVLPKLLNPIDDVLHDIAISAPTGSGKTLCYLIPILNQILCGWKSKYLMALVLAPTRTLIHQIAEEFNRFKPEEAKIVVLGDGLSYETERKTLFRDGKSRAHVIISTPQRLIEHLIDRTATVNMTRLRYLVVDEADSQRFVREEWLGMVERASNYPPMNNLGEDDENLKNGDYNMNLQKILVSATLSLSADKLYDWNLRSPCLYRATTKKVVEKKTQFNGNEAGSSNQKELYNLPTNDIGRLTLPTDLTHVIKICQMQLKPLFIYSYLARNPLWQKAMIFVNSVDTSRRLTLLLTYLFENERRISELSGNFAGKRRVKELKKLRKAEEFVVICSDTVGRGIDINDVDVIFNYDIPKDAKTFVHRAGRTARAGKSGHAVTLATKEEKLGFKRNLISVDIWDSAVEDRDKDTEFVKQFEQKYQDALSALKEKLNEKPLRKKFVNKKNRWKKIR